MVLVSCNSKQHEFETSGDHSVSALRAAIQSRWQHETGYCLKQDGRWLRNRKTFNPEKRVTAVKNATKANRATRRAQDPSGPSEPSA
eukprot:2748979-Alexandrium_andersonii.AAC.1